MDNLTGDYEQICEDHKFTYRKNQVERRTACNQPCLGKEHGKQALWLPVKSKVHQRISSRVLHDSKRREQPDCAQDKYHAGKHNDKIERDRKSIVVKINVCIRIAIKTEDTRYCEDDTGNEECRFAGQERESLLIESESITERQVETAGAPHLDMPRQSSSSRQSVEYSD